MPGSLLAYDSFVNHLGVARRSKHAAAPKPSSIAPQMMSVMSSSEPATRVSRRMAARSRLIADPEVTVQPCAHGGHGSEGAQALKPLFVLWLKRHVGWEVRTLLTAKS